MSTSGSQMVENDDADLTKDQKEAVGDDDPILGNSRGEKQDYVSQGSPPPAKAMPPKPRDPQGPPPGNRPPSTSSIQSATSNVAPVRTTTSRRGGRQRSRSPTTSSNRVGPTNLPERDFSDDRQSPANPSSAAAAAAAAAQALSSSTVSRNPQWFEGGQETLAQRERRPDTSRHPSQYDSRYSGSRRWPGEDDAEARRGYRSARHHEGEIDRPYATRGRYPSDRSGSGGQHEVYQGSSRRHYDRQGGPFDSGMDQEGRYHDPRSGSFERGADRPSPHDADRHHLRYSREPDPSEGFFRGNVGGAPVGDALNHPGAYSPKIAGPLVATPSTIKRSGGTTRVIGTATPIHVPRAVDLPGAGRHHPPPAGTPASVFRGRPEDLSSDRPGAQEEDSPQKILLSLRTPSASFDEQQGQAKSRKLSIGTGGPPLSPEEPPQIQHSHNQHQMEQALFFEQPNRGGSPKALSSGPMSGLEMAPSFSLFNQSFDDSLGDTAHYLNVSGPLEGTFNSASFGAGPSGSRDTTDVSHLLPNTSQAGSFAAGDRFLGSSSGGNYTFGMSPVNSFGNGPQASSSRRSGNMMVLGGPDQQPASPTQMLSMYPSYSGGYGSQGSGQHAPFRTRSGLMPEQTPMRSLDSESFGVGSGMYTRSYDASPHGSYNDPHSQDGPRTQDGSPSFYAFLGRNKSAFIKCSFLLPGLKAAMLESPITDAKKSGEASSSNRKLSLGGRRGRYAEPSPQDTAIAMRRIASAICAFGGTITGDRGNSAEGKNKENKQSIFREKDEGVKAESVAVTPSSSAGTPPGTRGHHNRPNDKYDELLPSRYYENENRLSWEFEETPPVDSEGDSDGHVEAGNEGMTETKAEDLDDPSRIDSSPTPSEDDQKPSSSSVNEDDSKAGPEGDQPKMRYRCKLCGLPKQNHTCAYQQSLQRSIGIMVYPAVNAFTSGEPGLLAPTLTDMNNFVISQAGDGCSSAEDSPSRPTPDRSRRNLQSSMPGMAPNVTPETMRSSNSSSSSGNSGGHRTPLRSPTSTTRKPRGSNLSGGAAMGQRVGTGSPPGSQSRKRTHAQLSSGGDEDLLFVETVDLKPEQFRIVTPSKKAPRDAYTYPALPLPYAQRKRLSDNLFALSKEVPQLTDECAVVLREARERDMWDLAVAELMTQVVVIIHCNGSDCRFEGLRHYLLTLGIAC